MSKPNSEERKIELQKFIEDTKGMSFLNRALKWFQQNVNEIVLAEELAIIPGKKNNPINHNMRRIFELRDQKGYEIINHKYSKDLKVDQWMLLNKDPKPELIRPRGVTKPLMMEVFERDDFSCQFCGRTKNDDDPFKSGRKITLHTGHIIAHKRKVNDNKMKIAQLKDIDKKKKYTSADFITMCNVCNEACKNNDLTILNNVEKILKLDEKDQKEIFLALKKKFT